MSKRTKSNPVFVGVTTDGEPSFTLSCDDDEGRHVRIALTRVDAIKMVTDVLSLLLTGWTTNKRGH